MFPTDLIMYSYFCVDSCDVGADKGIKSCRRTWRTASVHFAFTEMNVDDPDEQARVDLAHAPALIRDQARAQPPSAPFLHPNVSSSGAAPLRSLPAPPTLSRAEEQTAASPPAATVSSPAAAAAAAKPQIVTGRSRHVHADALASTCTPTSGLQHSPHSFFYRKPDPPWTL